MTKKYRDRLARASELQRLGLGELLEAERAELAADAALLEATKRRRDVEGAAVDVHLAGLHLPRERLRLLGVARPHAAGEAIDRVVGDLARLVFVSVGQDQQHQPEKLPLS